MTNASVTAYQSGDCLALPNGTVVSTAGDSIVAYFVDDAGRKSEPTKPIKVTAKP